MVTMLYLTLVFIVFVIASAFWVTEEYGKAAMVVALLAICTAVRYTFY